MQNLNMKKKTLLHSDEILYIQNINNDDRIHNFREAQRH